MKFRTQLLPVHPLLAAIRQSPFWQDVIERLVEPETPPPPKKDKPDGTAR